MCYTLRNEKQKKIQVDVKKKKKKDGINFKVAFS